MANPTMTRSPGRVLLGATGEGEDWQTLRAHLASLGWQVDLFDPTPHGDESEPEASLPLLEGVDLVILIAPSAARGSVVTARLIYLAGILRGTLGDRRVLAMLEHDADSLVQGANVTEIRFDRGNIRGRFPDIEALLSDLQAETPTSPLTPWLERLGIIDGRLAPELLLVLGVLVVLAAFFGVLGYQILGSSPGELSAELAVTSTVPAPGGSEGGAGGGPGLGDGSVAGPELAAPLVRADGRVAQLPARCVVDTSPGVVLPAVIGCEGPGGLAVTGEPGPWHGRIHHVVSDSGVVGTIVAGSPSLGDTARQAIEPGIDQHLSARAAGDGVRRLELLFSASGQQVRLEQAAADGGAVVTLTFGLDLG